MDYKKISGFSDEISRVVNEQFEGLNQLNIHYFEPRGIEGKNISELTDEEVLDLKQKMEKYGIQVSSIGSPIGKVKLSADFEEHFEKFKRVVRIAQMLETRYIRIFSFYHEEGSQWSEEERAEVLARLRRMIQYAQEQDIILLHENEKDIYGETADHCVDLMKELYGSHFKAVFDPANFVQAGEDTIYAFEHLKEYIEYMHIKDAQLHDGQVVPSGYGDGNVEYILRNLFANGFEGFLSLEPHMRNFTGFADLELSNKRKSLPEGGEGTFALAHMALCDILAKI